MPTPEGKLKEEVLKHLKESGILFLRLQSGRLRVKRGYMHLCPEGTPDFQVLRNPLVWIELKAPGQKTQKERAEKQRAFAETVKALGHRHIQATSLEQVISFLGGK